MPWHWQFSAAPVRQPTRNLTVETYKIVRHYRYGRPRTIKTGLTLEQAREHCRNPETSSSTCLTAAARRRTRRLGPWFDGYERD